MSETKVRSAAPVTEPTPPTQPVKRTLSRSEERQRQALIRAGKRIEATKLALEKIASKFPDPPTVDIALDAQRLKVIASSIGALPTVEEVQLGALELAIELSKYLVTVVDDAAHATPESIAARQSARHSAEAVILSQTLAMVAR